MASVALGGYDATAQRAGLAQAEAGASEDEGPPQPIEERPEPPNDEIPGSDAPIRQGESRRSDPFDDLDQDGRPRASHPVAAAHPHHDIVVCEAGCDGSAGTIVFMKRRE
jgi:hypothetical protein